MKVYLLYTGLKSK